MNVMYATDRNYAAICGVSLYSLLVNNSQEHIHAFIFEKGIGEEKLRFDSLCKSFDVEITFIDVSEIEKICRDLDIPTFRGGYTAYARLFADKYIGMERVLYLDCDTLVTDQLDDLWRIDLKGKPVAAVLDCNHHFANRFIFKEDSDNYINSGVILFDYEKWRENKCVDKIIESLKRIDINKTATCGDQDILNHAIGNLFYILPPEYNAMYITRYFSARKNYIVLSKNEGSYYSKKAINNARHNIKITHYSGRDLLRPWSINSALSQSEIGQWDGYLYKSPWKDYVKKAGKTENWKREFVKRYLKYNLIIFCWMHRLIKKISLYRRLK